MVRLHSQCVQLLLAHGVGLMLWWFLSNKIPDSRFAASSTKIRPLYFAIEPNPKGTDGKHFAVGVAVEDEEGRVYGGGMVFYVQAQYTG